MADIGLFEDEDVTAECRKRAAGRQPEQSGPDNRDVAQWCHVAGRLLQSVPARSSSYWLHTGVATNRASDPFQ
jgi:hypothetical protein